MPVHYHLSLADILTYTFILSTLSPYLISGAPTYGGNAWSNREDLVKPLVGRVVAKSVFVSEVNGTSARGTSTEGIEKTISVEKVPADTVAKGQPDSPV